MTYWAHSDPNGDAPESRGSRWQRLRDHLVEVGALAEQLAREAGGSPEFCQRARAAGLLHDYGKYSDNFQKMIRGELRRAPHSRYGAALAVARSGSTDLAFAIAGHHGGIPSRSKLRAECIDATPDAESLWSSALADCPELAACFATPAPLLGHLVLASGNDLDLHCRVLFSCLVDADRLNTASHANGEPPAAPKLNAAKLLEGMLAHIEERARRTPEGKVKEIRQEVLQACLTAGMTKHSLLSLTVPTGGGKTFSAMAFALQRAKVDPSIRRIIVVAPFLSIIEQNAAAYRAVLPDAAILEHHSGVFGRDSDEESYQPLNARLAAENWDAPIVVTTAVRFFESLFSNHPRDLRRFHNIAGAVVVLDEIQTLPRQYVGPVLSLISEISQKWNTTFLFSTATQPSLEKPTATSRQDPRWEAGTLHEIMDEPARLFRDLQRVQTEWRPGPMSWAAVAGEIARCPQVLVIVNTRKHAAELYSEVIRFVPGALHLSNNMCPLHKLVQIQEIHRRLNAQEPCLVIATQLVEAGVDIDFPVVWRAVGPLDSIAQAAGRCDRNGVITQRLGQPGGRLIVFEPDRPTMPKGTYRQACDVTKAMAAAGKAHWEDPAMIQAYFDQLYQQPESLDPVGVQQMRKNLQFQEIANGVQWIDETSTPILIPFNDEATRLIDEFRFAGPSLERFRRAQLYCVNLQDSDFRRAKVLGSVYELAETGIWACREGLYHPDLGIQPEGSDSIG
jgi:CRISPR-associated endonuclease/helicase Cas3